MAARVAKTSCFAAAGLALALSGCAGAHPPETAEARPPCDLICQVLRFFDMDQTAAPPAEPVGKPAPAKSRRQVQRLRPGHREAALHLRHGPQPAPQEEVTVEPRSPAPEAPVEPLADGGPPAREDPWLRPMAGSPTIAPPWFEPWPSR